jgi:mRNA-degrading endonuclease RelE of RelBE toxin-antitoxin system
MTFRVRIDPVALHQIEDFARYLRDYSEDFAIEQIERLDRILAVLSESPLRWSHFVFTGAPYRAYLFRVGRRTQYWIIYAVDEDSCTVTFCNSGMRAATPNGSTMVRPAGRNNASVLRYSRRERGSTLDGCKAGSVPGFVLIKGEHVATRRLHGLRRRRAWPMPDHRPPRRRVRQCAHQ